MPALIGLVAILMLFIGPVVSKSLEHRRVGVNIDPGHTVATAAMAMAGMDMSDDEMNGDGMSAMSEPDNSQPVPVHDARHAGHDNHLAHSALYAWTDGSTSGLMNDIACGYCQLLLHLPLMAWLFIPFVWLMLLISRAPPAAIFTRPLLSFFPGDPQPRAPPLFN
ncbi:MULTISPECIES: DUF2946 domain-containing protein [Sodalis]|jgi:hypothetical protein|uniref:DUF2946 family protein n=1 Tax=Sodalis ligni TaxID=2697027 RepID=A0A4R1NLZ9_9GAMM|nr:DUF2946 domain-containing protein [Sodalis ligni]TCL05826.1 DUF2946 family protein [Sodalis ligni]